MVEPESTRKRPPAPPYRPATTMEQPQPNPVPCGDIAERALCLVDLPLRGGNPGLLVGVRIAEQHLLHLATQSDDAPVGRFAEQLVHDVARMAQLDGL